MGQLVKEKQRNVVQYNPKKGLKKIASAKVGEERARRARDAAGMYREIAKKMKAQTEYILWRDAAMAVVKGMWSGPGRGKKGPRKELSVPTVSLPEDDPGEQTAKRWRKDFCTKVETEIDGKTKKVTVIDDEKFRKALEDAKHRALQACERVAILDDGQLVQQSTSNEHHTPAKYIEAARLVLGTIDLDPASREDANETVQATEFFDEKKDGLSREWHGKVFLNPPYGDLVGKFIAKLMEEMEAGRTTEAIVLVNAHCTDTAWFQALWDGCLCFTDHRINFTGDEARSGSTHGSVFVYFGPNKALFKEHFLQFGAIVPEAVRKVGDGFPMVETVLRCDMFETEADELQRIFEWRKAA